MWVGLKWALTQNGTRGGEWRVDVLVELVNVRCGEKGTAGGSFM